MCPGAPGMGRDRVSAAFSCGHDGRDFAEALGLEDLVGMESLFFSPGKTPLDLALLGQRGALALLLRERGGVE